MAFLSKLNDAIALQNDGQFSAASKIYLHLLKKKPKSFDARQLLALCYHKLNRLDDSLAEFEKAINIKKNHAASRNNFANLYLERGDFIKAKFQFQKAIKINPTYSVAYNNLGNCLQMSHDFEGAINAYKHAINLEPLDARFHDNLGVALMKLGRFDDALSALQIAFNLDQGQSSVVVHLFDLLMMMHMSAEAINIASTSLSNNLLNSIEKYVMHIGLAINYWLSFELESLSFHLKSSEDIIHQFENYPNIKNLRIFHQYLTKLLDFAQKNITLYQQKAERIMVMVSESHGFSPSATLVKYQEEKYRVKSFLITGAKIWHLSQTKNNMYNQSIIRFFANLPNNCTIILGFGEIDCRVAEGIYLNFTKTGNDYKTSIPKMIQDYVNAMLNAAKPFNHQIIFYGVPAPHPNILVQLEGSQRLIFLEIIRLLNQQLSLQCQTYNIPLLDVYTLTRNPQGESNLLWHLDDIHLHPKTFSVLFEKHLITNS